MVKVPFLGSYEQRNVSIINILVSNKPAFTIINKEFVDNIQYLSSIFDTLIQLNCVKAICQ